MKSHNYGTKDPEAALVVTKRSDDGQIHSQIDNDGYESSKLKNWNDDDISRSAHDKSCMGKTKKFFFSNLILMLTILGVIFGFILGIILRYWSLGDTAKMIVSFPGEILMRMLKMLILPLLISSLITGLAHLDPKSSGRMGLIALTYYFSTTVLAAILGVILVVTIHPGRPLEHKMRNRKHNANRKTASTIDSILDLMRNMFPENLVQATFEQIATKYTKKSDPLSSVVGKTDNKVTTLAPILTTTMTMVNETINSTITSDMVRSFHYKSGTNLLGIIVFCTAFGIYIGILGPKAKPMLDFFSVLNDIIMHLVNVIMWYSPIGICSLIIGNLLNIKDVGETIQTTGRYMATVITGLLFHALINLPLIYFVCTRKNPFIFMKNMLQAIITAIGTASSAATLPITFQCLEVKNKIDPRVSRFVLPIGATINMDGTAVYEAVAPIFIAQMNNISLSPVQFFTVTFTATVASIGAASIPSAGLVTMLLVLTAVGLPTEDISMIFAVDWMLDRIRTGTNVWGDSVGSAIVHHFSKSTLEEIDEKAAIDMENKEREINRKLSRRLSQVCAQMSGSMYFNQRMSGELQQQQQAAAPLLSVPENECLGNQLTESSDSLQPQFKNNYLRVNPTRIRTSPSAPGWTSKDFQKDEISKKNVR
ncbi:hypothetical protein SNEBB_008120 [Seison nebaliae]|nr:hypothetical protein SNEBB_008120 [Seison nebaliae]